MKIDAQSEVGEEWDDFVEAHPDATLSHAGAWARVLRDTYGVSCHYLMARGDGGALRGVLPLALVRNLRGKRELVSMPYLDGGGVLAADAEAEEALLQSGLEKARSLGAAALELRQLAPLLGVEQNACEGRVLMLLDLAEDEEAQWSALRAKVRNQTRKAERSGLVLDPAGDVAAFYEPFRRNMRDLGSPVHARKLFEASRAAFGERMRFVVSRRDNAPVGGLAAIDYAGRVSVPWASTLRAERASCPNNQIYWEAMRWAISRKVGRFDFGRSPLDGGTQRFKKGWGAEAHPMFWLRLDPEGRPLPASDDRNSSLLQRASRLWTKLPQVVTDSVGPKLRPYLTS